jgi:nicotinate-nucleotide adenylyltransferase
MNKRKIVLFGGTFDPIHLGHSTVAGAAGEKTGAEKVIFIPAKRSPLKAFFPEASDEDRLTMVKLAISGNKAFEASDYELKKGGASYTIETVKHFQDVLGDDVSIYWLAGADNVEDLAHWYAITELIDLCNLSVMWRGGCRKPDFSKYVSQWGQQRVEKMQANIIETPMINISSTEIRRRLSSGQDVSGMVSPKVLQYIHDKSLYGFKAEDA